VNAFTQLTQRDAVEKAEKRSEDLQEIEGRPKREPNGMEQGGLTLCLSMEDIGTLFALLIPVDFLSLL